MVHSTSRKHNIKDVAINYKYQPSPPIFLPTGTLPPVLPMRPTLLVDHPLLVLVARPSTVHRWVRGRPVRVAVYVDIFVHTQPLYEAGSLEMAYWKLNTPYCHRLCFAQEADLGFRPYGRSVLFLQPVRALHNAGLLGQRRFCWGFWYK